MVLKLFPQATKLLNLVDFCVNFPGKNLNCLDRKFRSVSDQCLINLLQKRR